MKKIAIIPARSGSKGLKNKNIKSLNGTPLLAYSIQAAINANLYDTVMVSTDSNEYAKIAREYGAAVPFLRSKTSASDSSSSWDAVKEVINNYKKIGIVYDEITLLQPTSPLRTTNDIVLAYKLFNKKNADSLVSVCPVSHPIQWCFTLDNSFSMENFNKNPYKNCRRQELEQNYMENGAIYIIKTTKLLQNNFNFYDEKCFAYIMDQKNSIDIDEELDFKIAEFLINNEE